jgi:hypothetical protein
MLGESIIATIKTLRILADVSNDALLRCARKSGEGTLRVVPLRQLC